MLAVLDGARLQRRQVGARVGLRVALAPDFFAREDLGGVALLLLLGAPGDDRGTGHADAEHVQDGRRLRDRHLLLEDQLLHEGEPAAAILLGPRESDESGLEQRALPDPEELVLLFARNLRAADRLPFTRNVLREPRADGRPESLLIGRQ